MMYPETLLGQWLIILIVLFVIVPLFYGVYYLYPTKKDVKGDNE